MFLWISQCLRIFSPSTRFPLNSSLRQTLAVFSIPPAPELPLELELYINGISLRANVHTWLHQCPTVVTQGPGGITDLVDEFRVFTKDVFATRSLDCFAKVGTRDKWASSVNPPPPPGAQMMARIPIIWLNVFTFLHDETVSVNCKA